MTQQTNYSKNPDLGLPIVTTIAGDKEYRRYCRKVGDQFYVKDRDIFFIEETDSWYFKTSTKVDYDWELNKCYLKSSVPLTGGVVDFDKDKNPIIGMFTPNKYNNVTVVVKGGSKKLAINEEILINNNYFEDVANNTFYHSTDVSSSDRMAMQKPRHGKGYTNKGYNIEDNAEEFSRKKRLYADYPLKINEDAKKYGKFLNDLTFGCEVECSVGNLPIHVENRHGIVACRDGSLEGGQKIGKLIKVLYIIL